MLKTRENREFKKIGVMIELKRWEYRVIDLIKKLEKENNITISKPGRWVSTLELEKVLNKLGNQGWELIHTQFVFNKREPLIVGFFKRSL